MTNTSYKGNESFLKRWGLIIKAAGITGVLLVMRLVFDYLNLDGLEVTSLNQKFNGSFWNTPHQKISKFFISLVF